MKLCLLWLQFLLVGIFLVLGVLLYLFNDYKVPLHVSLERNITPKDSRQLIIHGEFLLLPKENSVHEVQEILNSLDLEIVTPILEWLLVARKGGQQQQIILTTNPKAQEDFSILNTLLKSPHILKAHQNLVMPGAFQDSIKANLEAWHLVGDKHLQLEQVMELIANAKPKKTTIGVVDNFLYDGKFTFSERFSECVDRVSLISPQKIWINPPPNITIPHGEVSLINLGACNSTPYHSAGVDPYSHIYAIQRASLGHAQSFVGALMASAINPCEQSEYQCPAPMYKSQLSEPVDVLLLPFGGRGSGLLEFSSSVLKAIHQKNVIVVAAAGNDSETSGNFFPASLDYAISVGAYDSKKRKSFFSNYGDNVDLFAPGEKIKVQYPSGIKYVSGTSAASAFVAGAAALIKSVNDQLHPRQVEKILKKSGDEISCKNYLRKPFWAPKNNENMEECCKIPTNCGRVSLNLLEAIKLASKENELVDAVSLSDYYTRLSKYEDDGKLLTIGNLSGKKIKIKAKSTNSNILITPSEFELAENEIKTVRVSYKTMPFFEEISVIKFFSKQTLLAQAYVDYSIKK